MKTRTPGAPPAIAAFAPVPRKCARHDGWTPERQRAFIEALADTGSVSRAAAQVNMSSEGAYYLRRQPGADGFRRAWEAALDYGVARMKDIAFERAVDGTLVPVIAGGKLLGYRRIFNDRLLMFCLRHYGQDSDGKRTRIEYFSTKATAGAAAQNSSPAGGAGPQAVEGARAAAEASTTTVRTIISGKGAAAPTLDQSTTLIEAFDAAGLDAAAQAEIRAILERCAERRRALEGSADDEALPFVAAELPEAEVTVRDPGYANPRRELRRPPPLSQPAVPPDHFLEPELEPLPEDPYRSSGSEMPWHMLDDEAGMKRIEEAVDSVRAAKGADPPERVEGPGRTPGKLPPPRGGKVKK